MNHFLRGTIVSLALLAAGVCGVSLETSLFEEPRSPAGANEPSGIVRAPANAPEFDAPIVLHAPQDIEADSLHISYAEPAATEASGDQRSSVMMAPKVQLWNGQGMSDSEPCVRRCRTRCARRWVRCRP